MTTCCICMDGKTKIKCIKCKNAGICSECFQKLEENKLDSSCPVCRQKSWKSPYVIKSTKVFPISEQKVEVNNNNKKKINIQIILNILNYLKIISLAFGAGIITMYLVYQDDKFIVDYFWLGFFIGGFEFFVGYLLLHFLFK